MQEIDFGAAVACHVEDEVEERRLSFEADYFTTFVLEVEQRGRRLLCSME